MKANCSQGMACKRLRPSPPPRLLCLMIWTDRILLKGYQTEHIRDCINLSVVDVLGRRWSIEWRKKEAILSQRSSQRLVVSDNQMCILRECKKLGTLEIDRIQQFPVFGLRSNYQHCRDHWFVRSTKHVSTFQVEILVGVSDQIV